MTKKESHQKKQPLWVILFWILAFFLPFSFALNPAENIDLSSSRVFILIIFPFWLLWGLKNKRILIDNRFRFWALVFFVFIATLSFSWAIDAGFSFRKALFFVSVLPLYLVSYQLLHSKEKRLILYKIISWSAFFLSFFSILFFSFQFIFGLDETLDFIYFFAPFLWGNSFSELVTAFPSWMINLNGITVLRTFLPFPDPHLFSLFLNLSLPFVFYSFVKTKEKFYLLISFFIFLAISLSFSRAAYLSLLLGLIFLFLRSNFFKKVLAKPVPFFAGILFVLALLFAPNPISSRFLSSFDVSEGSNSGRIEMWKKGVEIIDLHPIGGVGLGNFSRFVNPSVDERNPIYAHNLFLDFGAETGIISMLLLLAIFAAPILASLKNKTFENKLIATFFVIFFIHSMFETPFYSVPVFSLFLIILSIDPSAKGKRK